MGLLPTGLIWRRYCIRKFHSASYYFMSLWLFCEPIFYTNMNPECVGFMSLCFFVLIFKAISLVLEIVNEHNISLTGCSQCSSSSYCLAATLFLSTAPPVTMMVLILVGWSHMKPYLKIWDVLLLILVLPCQIRMSYTDLVMDNVIKFGPVTDARCLNSYIFYSTFAFSVVSFVDSTWKLLFLLAR